MLVSYLSPTLPSPELAPFFIAEVEVAADDALVELGAANVLHAVQGVLVGVVLDEAEAAGRLLEAVEAHDQALDLAALAEELVDLLLGGVEGEVTDVEGAGVLELVFGLRGGFVVERLLVAAAFASALLYRC